ncbi:DUF948 domain-containing protein [Peribacillus asahii]|uniref:DUF948 domain-containing protein n=1 Tax=Peribacillus asahii TaxID=228899 RepID=UPI00207AE4B2|nr:DUF948 domain-containing protein [Peribacillus asahii]USK59116.1 DUF948 domain-containing protein [Peribacillus asahii]
MEIILYVSAAIIAIAFLVLVIYVARTLTSLQITLNSVAHTLTGLESQLKGITTETTELLHKTNALAEDLKQKSENLNTAVVAVKEVGTSIQSFNTSIQKVSNKVITEIDNNQEKISQIVQWGNIALEMRDKWKARKQQPESSNEQEGKEASPKRRFLRARS